MNKSKRPEMVEAQSHIHIEAEQGAPTYRLTLGLFHSLVGWQSESASGVKAHGLTLAEAKVEAAKLKKWLAQQEGPKA